MKTKGFKATNLDMTCRNFQFELGKTFLHQGTIEPCRSGFHFCKHIEYIGSYYNPNCRIFEVESGENTINDYEKLVTDEITLIKEINYIQFVNHKSSWVRAVVANKGIGLKTLVNDQSWVVRFEVARQGYGLDVLINDRDCDVRSEVARQGYGLDILVNDLNWKVRIEVARQGFGLDILVNDPIWDIRNAAYVHIHK